MRFNQPLSPTAVHVYEVRPRKDHRGVDVIPEPLTFGRLSRRRVSSVPSRHGLSWWGQLLRACSFIGRSARLQ